MVDVKFFATVKNHKKKKIVLTQLYTVMYSPRKYTVQRDVWTRVFLKRIVVVFIVRHEVRVKTRVKKQKFKKKKKN